MAAVTPMLWSLKTVGPLSHSELYGHFNGQFHFQNMRRNILLNPLTVHASSTMPALGSATAIASVWAQRLAFQQLAFMLGMIKNLS